MARGNPVGDFNTSGQGKCWFCGGYFPEAWLANHAAGCDKNPDNQEEENE